MKCSKFTHAVHRRKLAVVDLAQASITLISSVDDVNRFKSWLGERREWLAVDIETTGLNCGKDFIRLVQFGDIDTAWCMSYKDWRGVVAETLSQYEGRMVAHNLIFEQKMLGADKLRISPRWAEDTMIMAHLLDPLHTVALKPLATRYVDPRAKAGQGVLEQAMRGGGWDWATVPIELPAYWTYAGLDTILTARLATKLWPQCAPYREAYDVEIGATHVLAKMGLAGMRLDMDYVAAAHAKLLAQLEALTPQLPCNPNSPNKVREFLLGRGAVLTKRTTAGHLSVDDEVLAYWAEFIPEAAPMRDYRKASKLLSSYIENFEEMNVDGYLYPNVKTVAAKTGRQSVTEPALQTLPRGRTIRDAFIPREGSTFLTADFSQMELRVFAYYAQEKAMLAAFDRGEDLHNFVSVALYGQDFTSKQRSIVKNAAFSKIYGAGLEKFALTAKIDVPTAAAFLNRYDELFPGVTRFQEKLIALVQQRGNRKSPGWVNTIHGRRLLCWPSDAYKGTNYLIQGGCALVMKEKLIELDNAGVGDYMRLPIHDEILFEAPTDIIEDVRQTVHDVMPDRHNFPGVALEIDTGVWDRWGAKYASDGYETFIETQS